MDVYVEVTLILFTGQRTDVVSIQVTQDLQSGRNRVLGSFGLISTRMANRHGQMVIRVIVTYPPPSRKGHRPLRCLLRNKDEYLSKGEINLVFKHKRPKSKHKCCSQAACRKYERCCSHGITPAPESCSSLDHNFDYKLVYDLTTCDSICIK